MSEATEAALRDRMRDVLESAVFAWDGLLCMYEGFCGSPIEVLMFRALATEPALLVAGEPIIVRPDGGADGDADSNLLIEMQRQIGKHRVDFALTTKVMTHRQVVVECDGHAFHEKTKEQAARDKARDRDLLLAGWPVMRFTGAEIFRDAFACAKQVADFLNEPSEDTKAALRKAGYTC